MKIGILGSGNVGHALADGWLNQGHDVMIGTRSPGKLADWKSRAGDRGRVGSFAEAAGFGNVVVLAVKGSAAVDVVDGVGADLLNGKTVMDATNPIADTPPENGVLHFFTTFDESLMERLQKAAPGAKFVKAFNSIGAGLMVKPDFGGVRPSMFICGSDEGAKREAGELIGAFGFDVEDMGGIEAARAIEPLCMLWCIPGLKDNNWGHALKMLH